MRPQLIRSAWRGSPFICADRAASRRGRSGRFCAEFAGGRFNCAINRLYNFFSPTSFFLAQGRKACIGCRIGIRRSLPFTAQPLASTGCSTCPTNRPEQKRRRTGRPTTSSAPATPLRRAFGTRLGPSRPRAPPETAERTPAVPVSRRPPQQGSE